MDDEYANRYTVDSICYMRIKLKHNLNSKGENDSVYASQVVILGETSI
jgi:hypothetical protein